MRAAVAAGREAYMLQNEGRIGADSGLFGGVFEVGREIIRADFAGNGGFLR